ncbi:MAG: hypothetical protein ACYCW6_27770 [Candidatus Xenobia bacterium]
MLMRIGTPRWCAEEQRWQMQGEIVFVPEHDLAFYTANADIARWYRRGDYIMRDGRRVDLTAKGFEHLAQPKAATKSTFNWLSKLLKHHNEEEGGTKDVHDPRGGQRRAGDSPEHHEV